MQIYSMPPYTRISRRDWRRLVSAQSEREVIDILRGMLLSDAERRELGSRAKSIGSYVAARGGLQSALRHAVGDIYSVLHFLQQHREPLTPGAEPRLCIHCWREARPGLMTCGEHARTDGLGRRAADARRALAAQRHAQRLLAAAAKVWQVDDPVVHAEHEIAQDLLSRAGRWVADITAGDDGLDATELAHRALGRGQIRRRYAALVELAALAPDRRVPALAELLEVDVPAGIADPRRAGWMMLRRAAWREIERAATESTGPRGRPRREDVRKEVAALRAEGLSGAEIGRRLGLSRQRVSVLLRQISS